MNICSCSKCSWWTVCWHFNSAKTAVSDKGVIYFSDLTFFLLFVLLKKERKLDTSTSGPPSTSPQSIFSAVNFIHLICVGTVFRKMKPHAAVALRQGRLSHSYWNSLAVCRSRDSEPRRLLNSGRCLFPSDELPSLPPFLSPEKLLEKIKLRRGDVASSADSLKCFNWSLLGGLDELFMQSPMYLPPFSEVSLRWSVVRGGVCGGVDNSAMCNANSSFHQPPLT